MGLVYEAIVSLKRRSAFEQPGQKKRTVRSLNPSQPRDDPAGRSNQLFRFPQNLPVRMACLGRTVFIDHASISLRVNARAAREKKRRVWKRAQEIPRSIEIQPPIFLFTATARADAVD